MIYADYAATTPLDERVLKKMLPYFNKSFGNSASVHAFGREAASELENAREVIAKAINAQKNEIYFTSGGTESDNWALESVLGNNKKRIITSNIEHHAVLNKCKELEKRGAMVTYLEADGLGIIDAEKIKSAVFSNKDTALISIIAANNEIGTVQDLAAIGATAKEAGVLFHTDAVQAIGNIEIDVKKMHIDMLSASAHKFYGPKGIGFLYVRNGISFNNLIIGGSQEHDKRGGTVNVPGAIGMAEALKLQCVEREARAKIKKNNTDIIKKIVLEQLDDVKINGNEEQRVCGNLSFSFKGIQATSLVMLLDLNGICASSGAACSAGSVTTSHVIDAIRKNDSFEKSAVRISLSHLTTAQEAEIIGNSIVECVKKLRNKG